MKKQIQLMVQMLFKGLKVDMAYTIVVILVITSMFSTPLILGSIKNRVYVAIKDQIEKENNARELSIHLADSSGRHQLNDAFIQQLKSRFPQYNIVGNHKHVVMIEGPEGNQLQTLQILVPHDPRTEAFQIRPGIPDNFGPFDIVVSDSLGQLLYGDNWDLLWSKDFNTFKGEPLKLYINDIPLKGKFNIVARQTSFGRRIFANANTGIEIEKYTMGLGSEKLGLPNDPKLIPYSLPKIQSSKCFVVFSKNSCTQQQQETIVKRIKAENYYIQKTQAISDHTDQYDVTLTQINEFGGKVKIIETKGNCFSGLAHQVELCSDAAIFSNVSFETNIVSNSGKSKKNIIIQSLCSRMYELLPGIKEMMNQHGGMRITFEKNGITQRGIEMIAPSSSNIKLGSASLRLGDKALPAFITGYYESEDINAPFFSTDYAVQRLQHVADGIAIYQHGDPPLFMPTQPKIDYDEVLFYANQLEEVKPLYHQIQSFIPDYRVEYQIFAISKLERQDKRLSTLFALTMILSILFIIFSVGALAKINVDKRKRQMAQLFLLGFSKWYVSTLIVSEYLVLTLAASLASIGVGSGVFFIARNFIQSTGVKQSTDFTTIINAMAIDPGAFINVFAIVVIFTSIVSGFAAYYASKSDPVELLD